MGYALATRAGYRSPAHAHIVKFRQLKNTAVLNGKPSTTALSSPVVSYIVESDRGSGLMNKGLFGARSTISIFIGGLK